MADIIIHMPNGSKLSFPEGTSQTTIEGALRTFTGGAEAPSSGGAVDTAKTAGAWLGTRAIDATAGYAGLPKMVHEGANWFGEKVRDVVREPSRQLRSALGLPPDVPQQNGVAVSRYGVGPGPSGMPMAGANAPSAADVRSQMLAVAPFEETNTPGRAGRMLDSGVSAAMTLPVLGGGIQGLLPTFMGGAGSEGAGQLAQAMGAPAWAEFLARMGGGMGVAGLTSTAQSLAPKPTAHGMLSARMAEYTKKQIDDAAKLQAEAAGRGVPLMAHEALDPRSTGPLSQLAGTAIATPQGAPIRNFGEARLGTLPGVVEGELGKIGPRVTDSARAAGRLGAAAEADVQAPMIARSRAAEPHFTAAAPAPLDAALKAQTLKQIDDIITSGRILPTGETGKYLTRLRDQVEGAQTAGHLDSVLKEWGPIAKSKAFQLNGTTVPDQVRVEIKPVLRDAKTGLTATNPEYALGQGKYVDLATGQPTALSQAVTEAKASPAARMAAAQRNPATEGATGVFDKWLKTEQSPAAIQKQISGIAATDPAAARDALRLVLQRDVDAAFGKTVDGAVPLSAGVKTSINMAPTPQAAANIRAAIEGVTGNKTTADGFMRMLDILDRTNRTPGVGSPTATRAEAMREAGRGGFVGPTLDTLNVTRGSALTRLRDWNEQLRAGKSWGDLADMLADPASVEKLRKLAMSGRDDSQAAAIIVSIMPSMAPQGPSR